MKITDFAKEHPTAFECEHHSLYRYMPVISPKTKDSRYLKHLLTDGLLHLSDPSTFNDPFECRPHFLIEDDNKTMHIEHLVKVAKNSAIKKNDTNFNEEKAFFKAIELVSNPENYQRFISDCLLPAFQSYRICCFTPSAKDLLFWSLYADSHKGICIEFDSTYPPMNSARKVKYTDKYPAPIYPFTSDAASVVPVLTKSKQWEREEEFRITTLKHNPLIQSGSSSVALEKGSLKSVILGACISDEDKETAIAIARASKFNPKIFQTKLSETKFELDFDEIK